MSTNYNYDYDYSLNCKNFTLLNSSKNCRKIYNILVVDDDPIIAESLKIILNRRGHNVTIVTDGISCISHCKDENNNYDLFFFRLSYGKFRWGTSC